MGLLKLFILFLVLYSNAFAQNSGPKISGIMVQVEGKSAVDSKEFKQLQSKFNLSLKKYYPSLKVFAFRSSKEEELKQFCLQALKIDGVKHCELDFKLEPQNDPICESPEKLKEIIDEVNCELVPKKPAPHHQEGLSAFWAQEYTGADLVREKLKNIPVPKNLVAIWDSGSDEHGEQVANLIKGPHPSALIPAEASPYFSDLGSSSDYVGSYENQLLNLKDNEHPLYINNSMNWFNSKIVSAAIEKVAENSVFVSAADNDAIPSQPEKVKLAANDKVILVGSLDPNGFGSHFTSYSEELTISAPSDDLITSFEYSGKARKFGGTSGATPQVTAALAAFTMITGHPLSVPEAKKLLEKTALPFAHYPGPNSLGSGMLNTYKISEVAFRLAKECEGKKSSCVQEKLKANGSYHFENKNKKLLAEAGKVFPECHGKEAPSTSTCSEKKKIFNELRAEAFLNWDQPQVWSLISCISKSDGLSMNASYYESMSKRNDLSNEQLIADLFKEKDGSRHLLFYLFSHPTWKNKTEWVDELIKDQNNYDHIITNVLRSPEAIQKVEWVEKIMEDKSKQGMVLSYVLAMPHWKDHPEFVSKLLEDPKNDFQLVAIVLGKPHWNDHPEFVEKIINRSDSRNDSMIAGHVLSQGHWSNHPELLEKLILKGNADSEIDAKVLSLPEWQKVFAEKYGLKEVSVAEIRKKLKKN